MAPYRRREGLAPPRAPRDRGIVGDVINQFADRHAFVRELVQNAIDADSEAIEVSVRYEAGAGQVTVAVIDKGGGMSREVIENRLLVLFRSTKENDKTKIGKFGVGFASVLAIEPSLVRVTSVHAGQRHTLHLFSDLTYELFETGSSAQSGTTVEVVIEIGSGEVEAFTRRCFSSLYKWCRHATVPIFFSAEAEPAFAMARSRVDCPLGLSDVLFEVRGQSAGGATQAVVGLRADGEPRASFFNHGLTLFESNEPLAGKVAFKVQDRRLGHTLSRDNVRRDGTFDVVIDFVRSLVDRELVRAAEEAIREAAESGDTDRFRVIAVALRAAEIHLGRWHLPLVEEIDGQRSIPADCIGTPYVARNRSEITAYLAARGIHVIEERAATIGPFDISALRRVTELTLIRRSPEQAQAHRVLECTLAVLSAVHRRPKALFAAHLTGFGRERRFVACDDEPEQLVTRETINHNPFSFFRRRAIALNSESPAVQAALGASNHEFAGSLLARLILLDTGQLSVARSGELLERDLETLGFTR